jgi:hypothetical protein
VFVCMAVQEINAGPKYLNVPAATVKKSSGAHCRGAMKGADASTFIVAQTLQPSGAIPDMAPTNVTVSALSAQ